MEKGFVRAELTHLPPRGKEKLSSEALCVAGTQKKRATALTWNEVAPEPDEAGSRNWELVKSFSAENVKGSKTTV